MDPNKSLEQRLNRPGIRVIAVGSRPLAKRALFRWKPALASMMMSVGLGMAATSTSMLSSLMGLAGVYHATPTHQTTPSISLTSSVSSPLSQDTHGNLFLHPEDPQNWVAFQPPPNPEKVQEQTFEQQIQGLDSDLKGQPLAEYLLQNHDPFLALATTIETLPSHPYWDGGGLNIGIGYCITKRRLERGDEVVRDDLKTAGLDDATVEVLMGKSHALQSKVEITSQQALVLLNHVGKEYRDIARENIGEDTFDDLPENKQAALTWLAYNTGPTGFPKFKKLINAIQQGNHEEALKHLTPSYVEDGHHVTNARAGTTLMAAYISSPGLNYAIAHPAELQSAAQSGVSPTTQADPHTKLKKIPTSPYSTSEEAPALSGLKDVSSRLDARRQVNSDPSPAHSAHKPL